MVADFGDGLAPARDVHRGDGLEILGVDVEPFVSSESAVGR